MPIQAQCDVFPDISKKLTDQVLTSFFRHDTKIFGIYKYGNHLVSC